MSTCVIDSNFEDSFQIQDLPQKFPQLHEQLRKAQPSSDEMTIVAVLFLVIAAIALVNETRKKIATIQARDMNELSSKMTQFKQEAIGASFDAQISSLQLDAISAGAGAGAGFMGMASGAAGLGAELKAANSDYQGKVATDKIDSLHNTVASGDTDNVSGTRENLKAWVNGDETKRNEALKYYNENGRDHKDTFITDMKAGLTRDSGRFNAWGKLWVNTGQNWTYVAQGATVGTKIGQEGAKTQEKEGEQNKALFEQMTQQSQSATGMTEAVLRDTGQSASALASTLGSVARLLAGRG